MKTDDVKTGIMCMKCRVPLHAAKTTFSYLGNTFSADLPRCPLCGLVYVPEDLAKGRMLEVEQNLEDK